MSLVYNTFKYYMRKHFITKYLLLYRDIIYLLWANVGIVYQNSLYVAPKRKSQKLKFQRLKLFRITSKKNEQYILFAKNFLTALRKLFSFLMLGT